MAVCDEVLHSQLRNVHVFAITPFIADDVSAIDFESFADNLLFLMNQGVRSVGVGGGTGELEALSETELVDVVRIALETLNDQALVLPGVPGNLGVARHLLDQYAGLGARAVLALPPLVRWRVPSDLLGVVEYYQHLAQWSALPLVAYNTQGWPVDIFERLAESERIVAIKDPCQNDIEFFKAIKRLGDRFVWIGNSRHDPGVLQLRYQMGMDAFSSGHANFMPEPELAMHEAAERADWERVIALQEAVAPLDRFRDAHDDTAMVKAAMDLVGLHGGLVRPPRRDMPGEDRVVLTKLLRELDDHFHSSASDRRAER